MRIGILGSGAVGQTLGAKLVERGHEVMIGSRTPDKLQEWVGANGSNARSGSFAEAAQFGEVVLNATSGSGSIEALRLAGEQHLNGKTLIDIANPLDFSNGMPPSLFISNTDSLGETIQRTFPEVKVVKALNTLSAPLMADPGQLAGGEHHLFICGNDAAAKVQVTQWLNEWFGWKKDCVLDLGDITSARGTESLLSIWLRLWQAEGTHMFNLRIVR